MLKKFSVTNYKNFKNTLTLDFSNVRDYQYNENCLRNGLLSKLIIYGKNAVGKSNLGNAFFDIRYNLSNGFYPFGFSNSIYTNADSEDNEYAEFEYVFCFGTDEVTYKYRKFAVNELIYEQLDINDELIFYYDFLTGENDLNNIDKVYAGELNWVDFKSSSSSDDIESIGMNVLSVLRYIIHNTAQPQDSLIRKISQFVSGMILSRGNIEPNRLSYRNFNSYLAEKNNLEHFENFLNRYGVDCKLTLLDQPDGKKDLYFDYKKPLMFTSNMSSGTSALTRFYIQFLSGLNKPSFVFIDEFDAFYHFELSEKIVEMLENEFDCQVILTSHNTNLLSNSIMRPDCFFILTPTKLTSICDATNRELRQGHNLEKLYKNGEFDIDE